MLALHYLKSERLTGISGSALRYVLLSSIILVSIFSSLYYTQLKSQFDTKRTQSQANDEQLLKLDIKQSEQQFNQLIQFISSLSQVNSALKTSNPDELINSFDKHWSELQKNHQLNYIGFYNLTGNQVAAWSQDNTSDSDQQLYSKWINSVSQSDQQLSGISCFEQCNRYLVSPLIFDGLKTGYLITALKMNNLPWQIETATARISGTLSPSPNPEASTDILVYKWGYAINGFSIEQKERSVLQQFTKNFTSISGQKQVLHSTVNNQHYELCLYPLQLLDKSLLVILDDLSVPLNQLKISTLTFSLFAFFTLLTAQILLLVSIKRFSKLAAPVTTASPSVEAALTEKRISEIIAQNPLRKKHSKLRNDLAKHVHNDQIMNAKLTQLKQYNEDVNIELAQQMIYLTNERHVFNSILKSSPVIIMQLLKDGTIASINQFGETITGYSTDDLTGKNFIDLYPDTPSFALKDLDFLASIIQGEQNIYQHEAPLKTQDGKECIILWQHIKLQNDTNMDIQILSTGLNITQQKALEKNLSWLLNHDSLTTLFNRRRFEMELDSALDWANKYQADGCLLTIDLDNFKDINISCGHKVGDIILRKVASTLKELTKQIDSSAHTITARLGGDEFAIILRNIDQEGACLLSKRIITALNHISHFQRHVSFKLAASIGIATFSIADNNSTELLSNANFARNQAKMEGRNKHYIFTAENSHLEQTHYRMIWRDRIEKALKNDLFILHFQPILNIQQNKISHYETLIRMLDENDEIVSPGLFIHIAEQFGLIQQIDSFMIATAIAKQGELIKQGHDITLTINLSGKAFDDQQLFEKISQAIKLNNANPEHLVFEITETGAVSDIIAAEKMMSKIQALGCQFALDDFGIGFSSFNYLRELPFDFVKIDGSFVTDLANNADNKVLVQALSEVAIGFNKKTVAEFVDSRQTLEILKKAKVNYAQGYFIGKPSAIIPIEVPDQLFSTSIH